MVAICTAVMCTISYEKSRNKAFAEGHDLHSEYAFRAKNNPVK